MKEGIYLRYDKVKCALFLLAGIFLIGNCLFASLYLKERSQRKELQEELQSMNQAIEIKTNDRFSADEALIYTFYQTAYNFTDSPENIDLSAIRELTNTTVYEELLNEIRVLKGASDRPEVHQSSSVKPNDIKCLNYQSSIDENQYLVTIPVTQVYNGSKTTFELNQLLVVKDNQIVQRQSLLLPEE